MLAATNYRVTPDQLARAQHEFNVDQHRTRLNEPTGRFFYDPWHIRPEFAGTVWAELLAGLPQPMGEARVIILKSQTCYTSHADIDNRYHLNIQGESSYLIDLTNQELHLLAADGCWYNMDAGRLHTAANFGRGYRVQLVVRQLLKHSQLIDPVNLRLVSYKFGIDDTRFIFDNTLSAWLNRQDKLGHICQFDYTSLGVSFQLERSRLEELQSLVNSNFKLVLE